MRRAFLVALVALFTVSALAGCRTRVRARSPRAQVTVRGPSAPPPPSASVSVRVEPMQAGVTIVDNYCDPNAPEQCNGLDDNCNGVIDEGCGYNTGDIQLTLAWATGADLDMYVTDPSGYTISYQNTRSPTGGHLDHDARGACNRRQANNTIENVYWDTTQPPSGQYRVEVHYWGNCGVAGPTQATLSIAVGGEVIGAYNVMLQPRERQAVAIFNMP